MTWIIQNHERYRMNHLLNLAAHAYRGNEHEEGASVEEALEMVKKMFHTDVDKDQ